MEIFRQSMLLLEKISGLDMREKEHRSFWKSWEKSLDLLWISFRKKWKATERSAVLLSVRKLKKGNMEKVNDLLGFPFYVDGVIEHGRGMGHKVLLPTTNIIPSKEKLMPPNGVYDTVSHFKDRTLYGITNVGYKPTIGEKFLGVETYLFDCEEDLYGEPCKVEFLHYSRPEKRFFFHRSPETAASERCGEGKNVF